MDIKYKNIEESIFSGFISAIGGIGRKLFNEEIATISFGLGKSQFYIVTVAKELISERRSIYFVYVIEGTCNHATINKFSTTLFIEAKSLLKNPKMDTQEIEERISSIVENTFGGFQYCD